MNTSLTKFCKDANLPKSSVYRRCQELSIDTSEGLAPSDCDRLLHEFDRPTPQTETPAITATVDVGNHQIVLATPTLPESYTLESLRDFEAIVIDDPLAVAAQFLQAANSLTTAMQADIQAREHRLQQTKQAKDAIVAKAQELHLESRLYQLQTSALDKHVTSETSALQNALATLDNLGKSPAAPSSPPG